MFRCDECKHKGNCPCVPYTCEECFELDLEEHDKQIREDAIDECENYLIDSFNRANPCEMLSIGKVIEVFILLFNQLKEQNK